MGENAPFTYHKKEGHLLPIFAPFWEKSRNIFQRALMDLDALAFEMPSALAMAVTFIFRA